MQYTYDLNAHGCLILKASLSERETLREAIEENKGECSNAMEADALETLLANSELDWIRPEEIGALTDAPILGIREVLEECGSCGGYHRKEYAGDCRNDAERFTEDQRVFAAWGFMDYQVRSFLTDLAETGQAVFVS